MKNKSLRIGGWIVLSCLALALFAWIALPMIIRSQVNRGMANMKDGYVGHIEDVSIAWFDARLSTHRMKIDRPGREVGAPFMTVKEIQIEVLWREASAPRLGLRFIDPVLNFIDAPGDKNDQKGPGFTLAELRKKLPLDLGGASIENLELHFRNFNADPPIDTYVQNVNATAAPLDRCIQDPAVGCDAKAELEGTVMRDGKLTAHTNFKYDDAFVLNARAALRGLSLKDLNPLLLEYADVDVQQGSLGLDVRVRMDGSNYRAVLDPSLKDAKIIGGQKHQTRAGRELGLALAARFVERLGDELSIVLKGGSGRKIDWDITRRDEKAEGASQGGPAAGRGQAAHAALE